MMRRHLCWGLSAGLRRRRWLRLPHPSWTRCGADRLQLVTDVRATPVAGAQLFRKVAHTLGRSLPAPCAD